MHFLRSRPFLPAVMLSGVVALAACSMGAGNKMEEHDVVYVATEHNAVYAFDAADPARSEPLWKKTFGTPMAITPSTFSAVTFLPAKLTPCTNIIQEIGITSTPVIDRPSNTMY